MLIIIDGYNLIFTVPELEKYVEVKRVEAVRNYVVSLLSEYRREKTYKIVIVFDGTYSESALPRKQMITGISVIYSNIGVTADTEIKEITKNSQNPNDICIVTYDNEIKRYVKKRGCQIVDPKAFYKEVLDCLNKNKKHESDEPEKKLTGPSEQDVKYWTNIFNNLPAQKVEPESNTKNNNIPGKKRKKKHSLQKELYQKYHAPSGDDTEYWVRIFESLDNEEQNN